VCWVKIQDGTGLTYFAIHTTKLNVWRDTSPANEEKLNVFPVMAIIPSSPGKAATALLMSVVVNISIDFCPSNGLV